MNKKGFAPVLLIFLVAVILLILVFITGSGLTIYKTYSYPCKYDKSIDSLHCNTNFQIRSQGEACAIWDQNDKQTLTTDGTECCKLAYGSAYQCASNKCNGEYIGKDEFGCDLWQYIKITTTYDDSKCWTCYHDCSSCSSNTVNSYRTACNEAKSRSGNNCQKMQTPVPQTCGGGQPVCDIAHHFDGEGGINWQAYDKNCYIVASFSKFPYIHKNSTIKVDGEEVDPSKIRIEGSNMLCYDTSEEDIDKSLSISATLTRKSEDQALEDPCFNTECPEEKCEGTTKFAGGKCNLGKCVYEVNTPNSEDCGYVAPPETNDDGVTEYDGQSLSWWQRIWQFIKNLFT